MNIDGSWKKIEPGDVKPGDLICYGIKTDEIMHFEFVISVDPSHDLIHYGMISLKANFNSRIGGFCREGFLFHDLYDIYLVGSLSD